MKKLTVILIVLMLASAVFATQETFNVSSYEYQQVFSLCRAAGVETRQMVSPISADQLINVLKSLPDERLTSNEVKIKNSLINHLEKPYMVYGKDDYGFDAIITGCPDIFVHTANEEVLLNECVETRRDILPFFLIGGKVYFSDWFYGTFEYHNNIANPDRSSHFATNFDIKGFNIDINAPYRAYASFGKDKFNFTIGRDNLSLGNGKSGNLLLGDNFVYEDFAKFSYFNKLLSYDFTLITFDTTGSSSSHLDMQTYDFNGEHQLVAVHQLSFQPFRWFNLSLAEGMLQYGTNVFGDLSILNPFMMLHDINSYTTGSANNFFSIDFSVAVAKGWEINGSLYFDQIQQKQELLNGKPTSSTVPNANAFLLNTVYSTEILGGMADFYVEGVYTSPAVYLKNKAGSYGDGTTYKYYDVDLVVGNALQNCSQDDVGYLGYKYGPDSIVFATGFDYSLADKLQLSFEAMYKIHGEKGMKLYANQNDCNEVGQEAFYAVSPTGVAEHRLSFVANAKYSPFSWLTVKSAAGFITAWNYHNNAGKRFNDLQFALGVVFNPVHLATDLIKK